MNKCFVECSCCHALISGLCLGMSQAVLVPQALQRNTVKWHRGAWLWAQGFPFPDHNRKWHKSVSAQPEHFIWYSANTVRASIGLQQQGAGWVLHTGQENVWGALGGDEDLSYCFRLWLHHHSLKSDNKKIKLKIFTSSQYPQAKSLDVEGR